MLRKNLDMIAANEVGHDKAFDCADNELIVLWRNAAASSCRGTPRRNWRANWSTRSRVVCRVARMRRDQRDSAPA